MVNDLRELMHDASGHAPQDRADMNALLRRGRRRLRVRRAGIVGGTALAAGAISLASLTWLNPSAPDLAAAGLPLPDGPTIHLIDARDAVEGSDYRVLTSYTNKDLDRDNGQYFDGVTDDGLILFRDGPREGHLYPRYALMDPANGSKDWLPQLGVGQEQFEAIELSADRLVLVSLGSPEARVFDRQTREWSAKQWPGLPKTGMDSMPGGVALGPDGRLYIPIPATQGSPPPGGWPKGLDGEAEDAGAEGNTFDLWSVSLADSNDVRNEDLRVGSIGFTDDALVWTDAENGAAGRVHVRNLVSGTETSFDPKSGERCNLLGFDVAEELIMMSQYCGTYGGGVRDDRVQVVTTAGEQVITVQDSEVDGGRLSADGEFLTMTAYDRATGGTYVYDTDDGRFIRVSDSRTGQYVGGSGPIPGDLFLWSSPANRGHGATTWLSELL